MSSKRTISSWIETSSRARHQFGALLSAAPAEVSTRIAQKLRADERIGIGAQHNGTRLAACGPTHHVGRRSIPGHGAQRGLLLDIRALLLGRLASIGRRSEEHAE